MDVGSKEPLKVIKFDYLPEESPTKHGWALREGREEDLLSREDPAYGYVLWIKAEQDFCMDYDLDDDLKQACKAVEFVVKPESKFSFHAVVRVRSQQQGKTPSEVRLRYDFNSNTEVRYPEPHQDYLEGDEVEYGMPVTVEQLKDGWTLTKIDLPHEVATIEGKEWEFGELLTFRIKGRGVEIDVAHIELYKDNPWERTVSLQDTSEISVPPEATAQIFLSYAREDEEKVKKLYQKLSDAGLKPWMDKKDILPGEQWKFRIPQVIRCSDFFLVCLSANSVDKRGWIQKEIKEALDIWQEMLDSDIYVIPVRLEDCEVPERLRDFQWVNLFEEDGWTRLVKAIQVGIERRAEVIKPVVQEATPFEPYSAHEEPSPGTKIATPIRLISPLPSQEPVRKRRKRSHLIADSYADVTISFDFLLEQTEEPQDWAGIRLRGKKTSREGYFVIIRGDGRVEIVLVRPSSKDRIIRSYMLPHTSRTMHFAIAVVGTQISVELNGTEIMQGEADQYIDIGGVFLEVCRATATFSNLEIVPLVSDTIRRQVSPSGASPLAIPQQPPSTERPTPAIPVSPAIRQLANLIRALHEAGEPPCTLLLGSSLSLTPEVRRAACESNDWEAFWTFMEQLSNAERRAIMSRPLSGLSLAPGYRCLAELAQAGYFNIILTANVDDALDNALRILPASECQVLRHGQVSAQEIAAALSRITPRVKAVKLRGDINSSILPLTLDGQFEFPKELEEVVERLLSQDTILVGDLPYDIDIQRCFKGEGALCIVVPEEPRPGSFLYNAKRARPTGEVISGPEAEFVSFFLALVRELGVESSEVSDSVHPAVQYPIAMTEVPLSGIRQQLVSSWRETPHVDRLPDHDGVEKPKPVSAPQTITWLHLSDLHFRESRAYDESIVLRALLRDIAERIHNDGLQPDFIIISGDIAFASRPEEYTLAKRFLDDLLKTTGLPKGHLFLVPGNHDVDRSAISPLAAGATAILSNRDAVNRFLADDDDRARVFQRFHNYQDFVNRYLGKKHIPFDSARYSYVKHIKVDSVRVTILGLNSVWLAASDEDRNHLLLGERQVRTALDAAKDADLCVTVMHHPFDWLQDFDRNDVEPLLCGGCDFVLHGHMHQVGLLQARTPDTEAMVIAAGACYETRDYPNSYNFVQLDLSTGKGTVYLRMYSDKQGGFWTKDVINYRNVSDGIYVFDLPDHLSAERYGTSTPSSKRPEPITFTFTPPDPDDRLDWFPAFQRITDQHRANGFWIDNSGAKNEIKSLDHFVNPFCERQVYGASFALYSKDADGNFYEEVRVKVKPERMLSFEVTERTQTQKREELANIIRQEIGNLKGVQPISPTNAQAVTAPNPFGDTGRITDPERFFGRQELLRQIFEELGKGVNLSLVGESQIGKSSLLSMVCALGPERTALPPETFAYVSLEWVDSEDEFYEALCDALDIKTCRGFKLTRALRDKRYVLCVDEIEKMTWDGFTVRLRSQLRGLADGPAAPLKLVIASRSPLGDLFPDSTELTSPFAGICHPLDVGPFPPDVARAFLAHRLRGTGVSFTESEIAALLAETDGHPAKLQRAAADLYNAKRSA